MSSRFILALKSQAWKTLLRNVVLGCCVASLGILSTGCAFTKTKVQVQVSPTASNPLGQCPTAQLAVGEVQDTRPVSEKAVLAHKYNGYGQRTSGAYVAQKPVADIFKEGLQTALGKSGFTQSTNTCAFELRADIQDFDYAVITGLVKATVKPKLTVRFELFDKNSGASLWHDTLVGRDSMETAWGTGEFLAQTFDHASNDVIRQLLSNSSFRSFFVPKKS